MKIVISQNILRFVVSEAADSVPRTAVVGTAVLYIGSLRDARLALRASDSEI